MKRILCFGDSNTFGYNPVNGLRYSQNERWSGILQSLLGNEYQIIEAGCNNRTCFRDNFSGENFTGYKALPKYLSEQPDIVILWIGSNDLQRFYNISLKEIQYGIENLIEIIKNNSPNSKIILIPPLEIKPEVLTSKIFSFLFDKNSIEKSKHFSEIYKQAATNYNCEFLDLSSYIRPSMIDGLHFDSSEHKKIADCLYNYIKNRGN